MVFARKGRSPDSPRKGSRVDEPPLSDDDRAEEMTAPLRDDQWDDPHGSGPLMERARARARASAAEPDFDDAAPDDGYEDAMAYGRETGPYDDDHGYEAFELGADQLARPYERPQRAEAGPERHEDGALADENYVDENFDHQNSDHQNSDHENFDDEIFDDEIFDDEPLDDRPTPRFRDEAPAPAPRRLESGGAYAARREPEAAPRPPQSLRCLEIGRPTSPFERDPSLEDPDALAERVVFKLWSDGLVKGRAIEQARREAGPKLRLDQALTRLRLADPEVVAESLAQEIDAPMADDEDFPDAPVAMDVMPKRFVCEALAVPLADDGETLALAMADPLDDYALRAIAMKSRRRLSIMVACAKHLEREIERIYRGAPAEPEPRHRPAPRASRSELLAPQEPASQEQASQERPSMDDRETRRAAPAEPDPEAAPRRAPARRRAASRDAPSRGRSPELDEGPAPDLEPMRERSHPPAPGRSAERRLEPTRRRDEDETAAVDRDAEVREPSARRIPRRVAPSRQAHAPRPVVREEAPLDAGPFDDRPLEDHGGDEGGRAGMRAPRKPALDEPAFDDMLDDALFQEASDDAGPAGRSDQAREDAAPEPKPMSRVARRRAELAGVKRPSFVRPHRVTLKNAIARDEKGRPVAVERRPAAESGRQTETAPEPVRSAPPPTPREETSAPAAPGDYAPGSIAAQVAAQVAQRRAERAQSGDEPAAHRRAGPLRFDEIRSHAAAAQAKSAPARRKVLAEVRKALGADAVGGDAPGAPAQNAARHGANGQTAAAPPPEPRRHQAAEAMRERAAQLSSGGAPRAAAPTIAIPKPRRRSEAAPSVGEKPSLALTAMATSPETRAAMAEATAAEHGLILLVGPSGSGKISTVKALAQLRAGARAKPRRFDEPGAALPRGEAFQVVWGEIRDAESAEAAARAAMGGALVFATLDAVSAAAAAPRLIAYGLPPYALASSLRVVMTQTMSEEPCTRCAQTGKSVRGDVCPECGGAGRIETARLEDAMVMEDATRALILAQAPEAAFRHAIEARATARRGDAAQVAPPSSDGASGAMSA